MTDEQLREAIRRLAPDGRAACKDLLELADRTNTPRAGIGALCDEMKIRIAACQLGCFR